ncbi:MAG: CotH kinase family protein [Bacteroidaceae bacterium]|nr:CotH kinase family protein [Bacteroidaceae bacterium]
MKIKILLFLLCFTPLCMLAQVEKDYTQYVLGADCNDGQYWYLVGKSSPVYSEGVATNLQCDTWSGRGGKDDSNMITPFMEFHRNASESNTGKNCKMPAVEIRHQIIEGLPKGKYKIRMLIRCYAELYNGNNPPAGVKLYANGVESSDVCEGVSLIPYNGGVHATSTPELIFEVGDNGILDFGINVTDDASLTEMNWVSWKDVKLTYLEASESIARTPFKGEISLPGTVEAENFDKGGEGITYHDNDAEDYGGTNYRSGADAGVDIVTGNGGYAVGWIAGGEWIEYSVNVTKAGKYTYEAIVSNGTGSAGGFSISLVGNYGKPQKLADVRVPSTESNWDNYQPVKGDLLQELSAGTQTFRVTITDGNCNIDKIIFDLKPAQTECYIRNKASGHFMEASGGKDGNLLVQGQHGMLITTTKFKNNQYYLSGECNNEGKTYFGFNKDDNQLYVDGSYGDYWTIEEAEPRGYFTIRHTDKGIYLASDGDIQISSNNNASSGDEMLWEFIPRTTRIKELVEGTATDATFLIADPRFDPNNIYESEWRGSSFTINGDNNANAEVWGGSAQTFDIFQKLVNIPNGRYQLKAQGFYRYNDNGENSNNRAYETHMDGTEKLYAKFYAKSGTNSATNDVQSIVSEKDNLSTHNLPTPMSQTQAGNAFLAGLYNDNTLEIDVTNHRLMIGVRKEEYDGCDWTVWDNFELTLLSLGDNSDYKIEEDNPEMENIAWDKATPDNPVDCTSLIKNPDFNSKSGWIGNPSLAGVDNSIVSYGGTGVEDVTFDVYQNLSNMHNGIYRLKAKGFYRYGDVKYETRNGYGGVSRYGDQIYQENTYSGWDENQYNDVWVTYTIPYAVLTHRYGIERQFAILYGNTAKVGLPLIFTGAKECQTYRGDYKTEFGWVPDNATGASEALMGNDYEVELLVPVIDGTLQFGVCKDRGYKFDWTVFDDFRLEYLGAEELVYTTGIETSIEELNLNLYEQKQLSASILPLNASIQQIDWYSSDCNIVSVDATGIVTAMSSGTGHITVRALGGAEGPIYRSIPFTVKDNGGGNISDIVINEIQVSNLDMFLDKSNNYGGYIELYNPTDQSVSIHSLYVSDVPTNPRKSRIGTVNVPAKGFTTIFFDHNSGESGNYSGNANFKLEMDGGTIGIYQNGNLITSVTYPAATSRTSYARTTDGGSTWGVTAYPTPGFSNAGSKEILDVKAERVPAPEATATGFYMMSGFEPTITGEGNIYCTTDGTVPSEESIPADELPVFNGTTVLRMRAFEEGKLPSPVVTYTYVQQMYNHTLPVLMVTAAPDDIYSDEKGIFVTGTNGVNGSGINYACNWNREWDRSANMQLLSKDGESLFQQDVNIARFGGWSRSWVPYNFKLKAQKQYEGNNYLEYPFFKDNKPYLKHKVLQVRNGGNDIYCRIKDASLHNIIISSGFYLDCLDYQPVHCYINGQYYGMQNLREPSNKHYGLADYGIDTDEMDAMEITWGVTVKAGNADAFNKWENLSYSAADEDVYRQICDIVDVEEFINYMAAQIYLGGDDWPGNNCKGFKGNDGKFHIVFFDVDQAFRYDKGAIGRVGSSNDHLPKIFKNMLSNDTFRKQFIDSFCLFGGSVMQPQRCYDIIDRISAEMNPALALEGLSTSPTAEYMKQEITKSRHETMINSLRNWSYTHLNSDNVREYKVKLSSNIEAGKLLVNGLPVPTNTFDGNLFAPIVVTAAVPEGYTFKGWKTEGGEWLLKNNPTLDFSVLDDEEALYETLGIQAVYEEMETDAQRKTDLAMPIKVNEVSAGNTVFASETWKRSDWIELYNTTDTDIDVEGLFLSDDVDQPLKFQIQKNSVVCNTVIPAGGHLIVWADGLGNNPTQNQLHANFKLSNSDDQQVIVVSGDAFVGNNAAYFDVHPHMKTFIDGMTYSAHRGDETVGRFPDGGRMFYKMGRPTPERTNTLLIPDVITGEDENLMDLLFDGFRLELARGWNWTSHCLYQPVALAELPQNALRVLSQTREAYREGTKMMGTFSAMDAGVLYKIQMKAADTFTSDKLFCNSNMPIALMPGWNWIGYPVDGSQQVKDALEGFLAEEGDKLIGQDGFATYTNGSWIGSLTSFDRGKGYMLYTQKAKSLRFNSPELSMNLNRARVHRREINHYGVDKHAYPCVMGIIGTLMQDETPVDPDRFTLLVYAEGECRGSGIWMDGQIFLTAYGEGGETLQFFAFDELDGTVYPVIEHHEFETDVKGTLQTPSVFHIGDGEATNITELANGNVPHISVEGYYNLSGLRIGNKGTSLSPGIYFVKYQDGSFRKIYIH